jgi:diguanylate cyclase (GGDEF)-like protein
VASRDDAQTGATDPASSSGGAEPPGTGVPTAPAKHIEAPAATANYQKRLFAQVESMAHIGSFVHEADGRGLEWSEEMFNILDWPSAPPSTLETLLAAFTEEGQAKLRPAIAETLAVGKPFDLEATLVTGRGQLKLVRVIGEAAPSDGGARRLVGIAQDITERRQVEDRNWRLANHDFLTRLPNRRLFEESLERAIERGRINGGKVGLLLVDLDYFKEINASLGHETGDVLLHVVAGRLRRAVGPGDEVARIGGDEFAVLVGDPEGAASLVALSRKILQAVEQGVPIRDSEVAVRASIGGALFPDHARGVGEILDSAQAALARAKTTGRRIALVYEEEMRHESDSRFRIHESIRGALARDEIFPYYQTKVHLETGDVLGLEALVRWRTGPNGLVFPAEFGSALSDGFLGSAIATRVLEKVTDDIRDWLDASLPFGSVAVNVTAIELMRGAYHEQVAEVLQRKAIPFDRFQVEVTETVFLQFEGREIRDTIARLDALGVKVALDDFGTGFGSLVHLRRLAVSQIKIDRSFIERIDSQPEDVAIVKALIALGKDLGKRVIAEGIEREEERRALIALGCVEGQGYLFGLPLPKADTTRLLEAERERKAG